MANVDTAIINVATPVDRVDAPCLGRGAAIDGVGVRSRDRDAAVTAARMGTLYGYRRIFSPGLVTFTLASFACGIAPTC